MPLQIRTEDREIFAEAWLATAKAHMRVEFDDDDTYIRNAILRAAAEIEGVSERQVVPREYVWRPERVDWWPISLIAEVYPAWSDVIPSPDWPGAWKLPSVCMPVKRFRATIGGDDRSPAWRIVGSVSPQSLAPAWLVAGNVTSSSENWTVPSLPSGDWVFYLRSGYASVAEMPPMIADKLLRLIGHIYENREAMVGTTLRVDPLFTQGLLGPLWLPRC